MKILSCGSGMQSTALALMSCENKLYMENRGTERYPGNTLHPMVPVYDAIVFCDLGLEPEWVKTQTMFIKDACEFAGIPFYILKSTLYEDYLKNFGKNRVVSIPFWTIDPSGKKGRMMRSCTLEYKVQLISKFTRWNLLGYKKGQRLREEDVKAHEMHLGFSYEERNRANDNPNALFINKFPLIEMKVVRADNYEYIRDVWHLDTKASACCFCPFHTNYFFQYSKEHDKENYRKTLAFDEMLEREQPNTKIFSKLYISRSRKRIKDLLPEDCNDAECFKYHQKETIWNGF